MAEHPKPIEKKESLLNKPFVAKIQVGIVPTAETNERIRQKGIKLAKQQEENLKNASRSDNLWD